MAYSDTLRSTTCDAEDVADLIDGILDGTAKWSASAMLFAADTSDGADSKIITICGGGSDNGGRGAYLALSGNECATNAGAAILHSGTVAGAYVLLRTSGAYPINFMTNSVDRWQIAWDGRIIGQLTDNIMITSTSDASDTASLKFCGGGAAEDVSRGAYLSLYGNEHASGHGSIDMASGNIANANVTIRAKYSAGYIDLKAGDALQLTIPPGAAFKVASTNLSTGSKTCTLGTNGPNGIGTTTPTTWMTVQDNSGNTGYIPIWR